MMGEWDWLFFYDNVWGTVQSVTNVHQNEGSIGALAEAHPDTIYFYAEFRPLKEEWEFDEVVYMPPKPWTGLIEVPEKPPFEVGVDHATIYADNIAIRSISIDPGPNAWGHFIHLTTCPTVDLNVADEDVRCTCRPEREAVLLEDTPEKHINSNPQHSVRVLLDGSTYRCLDCAWLVQPLEAGPTTHPICIGVKGCGASKHANDCPEWYE